MNLSSQTDGQHASLPSKNYREMTRYHCPVVNGNPRVRFQYVLIQLWNNFVLFLCLLFHKKIKS